MKRVWMMLFSVLLLIMAVPQTARAAEPVKLTVKADKAVANPGDTITYTVYVGEVSELGGMDLYIKLPVGLTIEDNSIAVKEGIWDTLLAMSDFRIIPNLKNDYHFGYIASAPGYTITSDLALFSFSCTVDSDAAFEEKAVSVNVDALYDNWGNELENNVTPAEVTIEKRKIPVTGVQLDKTSVSVKDGETVNLEATVDPADADNKTVTWSSDNTAVATVANGTVTAVKTGKANITVTTEDGSKTAVCEVTVSCNHNMSKTEAVVPTCGKAGNIEYYTCSKCGNKYKDEAGTMEVTDVTDPATGDHKHTEVRDAKAATEEETGYTGDTYCTDCGNKIETGSVIPKLPHTHAMTKTPAVSATCEEDGTIEYYTCSKCGKKYADEAGTKEVTDITVKATGHKADGVWKTDEENHWQICEVCSSEVNKTKHSYSWKVDKAATEDETGLSHEECVCGLKRNEGTVIPKLDHVHTDIQHHAAVEATCVKEGSREYWTCSSKKCAGKYYGDKDCQIEIKDIVIPINSENHVKGGVWEKDDEKHVRICTCGAKVDEGKHVYDDDKDVYCNVCEYQRYYVVTNGADAVYEQNAEEGLTFRIDGELELFKSLEIDGKVVDPKYYTLAKGSTIITLKNSYLNTLSVGSHSIKVAYTDGKVATTSFSVREESKPSDSDDNDSNKTEESESAKTESNNTAAAALSPKTGDESHMTLWVGMLFAVMAGIAITGVAVYRLRRR